ncbi:GNAT family N-acetyltransferase [Aestuariirhabdus sp. Z084]|uniref:GNAT family N-acetyltransferase n=1 Tax=Aestuariirhabdus haliotis TaxID=2918751 RepID=UPI00201B412D|nr:GNAT family N-acetyltransferase [Aestuariirhabdus haliotis]MCL6417695.1 GNAT family N-acetyltransferase [Aestuariirhabdus haliotis]MCL6421634.1 GNAT family N-acetyltransferase [Aestuariirhabdus haliotis]
MMSTDLTIKTMNRAEVDIAVEWAADEGWNPGLHDADCYYATDPKGFLIGYLGQEAIATISVINYSESFGFLGFYIVKPEYRGQGYGMAIWNAGIQSLEGHNIALDGVVTQQENYKKSGFKFAYSNIRYQGNGGGQVPGKANLVELSELAFATIAAYEQPFFPANRSHFLRRWIEQPDSRALGIIKDGELAGYGVIRACRSGCKIGPLVADDPQIAENLFLALKATVAPSDFIYLDIPAVNQAAIDIAKRYNMQASFETARMYTGNTPNIPLHKVFGVTSFEIG